jgi:carboxyl-terminal processing protease
MKRRLLLGALLCALVGNLLVGAQIYFASAEKNQPYPNLELFSRVLEYVRKDYVDGQDLTYQELIYSALKGMLSNLDPHSEFMEPVKYEDLRNDTQGEFGGVGIVITMKDSYLTVVAPMEDTPGFRAGILSGDRIIRINGKSTTKLGLQDAVQQLRGAPGTDVEITFVRPSTGEAKDLKLTRAVIKVSTVKDLNGRNEFPLDENKIGYIRLTQFGEQTAPELDDALSKLTRQGMESLVLDLRGNPGGLLDQAVRVAEKFLPRGQLVVSTEGRDKNEIAEYHARGRGKPITLPVAVLVNHGSASASEIVAGCLQDATGLGICRALLVGEQTFGKGSVQSILPLPDGSALRLTTAKYYTPSHKVIHEQGITPDIVVAMTDEEERDMWLKRTPGGIEALPHSEQERIDGARDPQLERAVDLLKGLSIYSHRSNQQHAKPVKLSGRIVTR